MIVTKKNLFRIKRGLYLRKDQFILKRKGRDVRKEDFGCRNCFTIVHMSLHLQGFVLRINIYRKEEGR